MTIDQIKKLWPFALVAILGFLIYGQSLHNNFIGFDDDILIFQNPIVWDISWTNIVHAFTTYDPELYIPFTFLSYQLDWWLGNGDPFWFHLGNLNLHIINSWLVIWLVQLLRKNRWVAVFCGLLFVAHPLHTEAVAWASARKDVLATLFFLGSAISYLYYTQTKGQSEKARKGKGNLYVFSLTLFLFALLAKVSVILLPGVLLLIDYLQKRKWDRSVLIEKIPFVMLSVIFGIIAVLGKQAVLNVTSHTEKILMAFKSVAFYLEKLIWPSKLSVIYPFQYDITVWSWQFIGPILLTCGLLIGVWCMRKRTRMVTFCAGWFALMVAPTFTNFAKAGEIYVASDRYAYIPSIAVFILVGLGLAQLWKKTMCHAEEGVPPERNDRLEARHIVLGSTATIIIVVFSLLSHRQSLVWHNDETFFTHALSHYPHSAVAHSNYANALVVSEQYDRAIAAYEKALEINDEIPRTWGNLVLALGRSGQMERAFVTLAQALEKFPDSGEIYFRLGDLYAMQRQEDLAKEAYAKALELDPEYVQKSIYGIANDLRSRQP